MEGKNFTIMLIGPNTFQAEAKEFKDMLGDLSQGVRLILAEPNLSMHKAIKANAASVGFTDVTVTHAAISENDKLDLTFWWYEPSCADRVLSPLNDDDKNEILQWLSEWASFSRNRLESTMEADYWKHQAMLKKNGMDKALIECIASIEVPIISPKAWLDGFGLTPEDVDLFFVDTEGFDVPILNSFLKLEGLKPEMVQFEWTGTVAEDLGEQSTRMGYNVPLPELPQLLRQLSSMGYNVYQDHHDMTMIKQP